MEMTITNFRNQKSINVNLPDDFAENANDIRVVFNMEQYELKSTKSEEDKQREKAAVEFGEEAYADLYKQYPNFGTEKEPISAETMKSIIKDKLNSYGEKYKVLLEDKNPEQLYNGLTSAFSNYCSVRRKMEEEEHMIEETKLDDNVFFDYIKRFKKAFEEATCIKDIHEAIVKLHQLAGIDKRELFGYTFIFKCLSPFYDRIKEIEDELKGMKPEVLLKDHALFTDKEWWKEATQGDMINVVIKNLDTLEETYRKFIEESKSNNTDPFIEYATKISTEYTEIVAKQKLFNDYLLSIANDKGQLENVTAEQTEKIHELVNIVNNRYRELLQNFAELRTKFNLDARVWESNKHTIIDANFGLMDFWSQEIIKATETEKNATVSKMIAQLTLHSKILKKVIAGKLEAADLINGKYTTEDLVKLADEPTE